MSISQFVNSLIKRLSPSVLIWLAVVGLVAGCGGPAAVPPPAASTPPGPPSATAFVLTDEQTYDILSAVALRGGRLLWSARIPGQADGLVVAPRLGRAGHVAVGL
jgi:hypothetical protein